MCLRLPVSLHQCPSRLITQWRLWIQKEFNKRFSVYFCWKFWLYWWFLCIISSEKQAVITWRLFWLVLDCCCVSISVVSSLGETISWPINQSFFVVAMTTDNSSGAKKICAIKTDFHQLTNLSYAIKSRPEMCFWCHSKGDRWTCVYKISLLHHFILLARNITRISALTLELCSQWPSLSMQCIIECKLIFWLRFDGLQDLTFVTNQKYSKACKSSFCIKAFPHLHYSHLHLELNTAEGKAVRI